MVGLFAIEVGRGVGAQPIQSVPDPETQLPCAGFPESQLMEQRDCSRFHLKQFDHDVRGGAKNEPPKLLVSVQPTMYLYNLDRVHFVCYLSG
jgi:hypothetical protein